MPRLTLVFLGTHVNSLVFYVVVQYCKFENFAIILFSLIDILATLNIREYDLPISVNNRVISPFHKGFIAKFRENKTLAKISEFTVSQE